MRIHYSVIRWVWDAIGEAPADKSVTLAPGINNQVRSGLIEFRKIRPLDMHVAIKELDDTLRTDDWIGFEASDLSQTLVKFEKAYDRFRETEGNYHAALGMVDEAFQLHSQLVNVVRCAEWVTTVLGFSDLTGEDVEESALTRADLRVFRARLNLKQSDVAAMLGVTRSYVSMMESGDRPIPAHVAAMIAALQKLRGDVEEIGK